MKPLMRGSWLFAAPLAALLLTACGGGSVAPASSKLLPLKTAINGTSPSAIFHWVTKDAGIYARHGLDVELTPMAGSPAMKALIGGDIDFAIHAGPQLVLSAFAAGTPLKVVAAFDHVYDVKLVVPNDITSIEQLRGKRLGMPDLSAENGTAAITLLREKGLQPNKDYQIIQTGSQGSSAGIVAQMITKQVDFSALAPIFADQAVAQGGYHVLMDFADSDLRVASQVLTVPVAFVEQKPVVLQTVLDSLIEGVKYFKTHKADAFTAMKVHYLLEDQAQMEALYDRQVQLIATEPSILKEDLESALAGTVEAGSAPLTPDQLTRLVDNHFVEDAVKRGVTKS